MISRDSGRASARTMRAHAHRQAKRSTTKRRVWIGAGVAVVLILGAGTWVATRALVVKNELESAQGLVGQMQTEASDFNLEALAKSSDELLVHSASAVTHAQDPIWRAAEVIPYLGDNLAAVRVVAESIDAIAQDVAAPAVDVVTGFDLAKRDPETGGFDLSPLTKAEKVVAAAKPIITTSRAKLDGVNQAKTFGPVTAAVVQLQGMLSKASGPLDSAGEVLKVASAALGRDSPRNYLLAFQNNAESTALGGSAASYTMLSVDNGAVAIAAQAGGSNDLQDGVAVDVTVDQSALDLYSDFLISYPNSSTSRPDFPTAAQIMSAFWLRDKGKAPDGVISVDPLALAEILKATGPVTLSSGDVLTSDNAVSLLVNEIYFRYGDYDQYPIVDAFFQNAAASILAKVTAGDFDIKAMVSAITAGVDQGSILMWSADADEQSLLDGARVQGVLPKTNATETVIGTYYRDTSASKIDYYLETSNRTTTDVCTSPENPTFTTSVTLHSNLTVDQARALPDYIKSQQFGSDFFSTQVFVYGPVDATLKEARVDSAGEATVVNASAVDLGRPVASFTAYLAPGETTVVTATFTGAPGTYGPVELRGTPMINATAQTLEPADCG
ncbi:DUF4012 domain-containing protein [Cryobacterium sp. Hz9]|uniref:DUF4012 domain-containing protein n=1 Tax=Cryobacterium sp. Hz9 TaxID=1259167 RepID=UPI00106D0A85|nr:DUF4012 domain-containing protein [Cryobacterium sp. Hz9]TFB65714.1 DUF4012 domain-containing protein [Cryobacterium sp. Hz9]